MPTASELFNGFVEALIAEEAYDECEGVWRFADGSDCSVCFSSAALIAREFDGVVAGYWSKSNSSAKIGGDLCEGHDFAFIEGRWIVDYWAFRVAGLITSPVLDLEVERDRKIAKLLYGELAAWEVAAA